MKTPLIGLVALVITCAWPVLATAADGRPNILIVLTDDQGMGDFSCYGNPVLKTPNLDRLHGQSIRFTDFHAAPMCTPTRGQLMTGLDAVRNGATSVTGGRSFIRPGVATLPELLANGGYRTGIFGKWHLGDNYPHRPMDRGFQEAVYHKGWGYSSTPDYANTLFDGRYFHNGVEKKYSGHCTDFWFDRAMAWMRERKDAGEPFFCYLPLNAPHAPHVVAGEYSEPYKGKGPAEFYGMIAQIDWNMGKLEKFLDETGLRENTLVIFMTDNGGTAGVKKWNAGLREGKTTYYEGGHRVPCWVRWPAGKLGEPRDVAVPTQVQDILPTVLELAGVKPAVDAKRDGTSLAGLLKGKQKELPDRTLVVQYSRAKLEKWECAVVWNQWRLVKGSELYDVSNDRAQEKDLAAEQPEIVAKLRAHYEKWWGELEPRVGQFVATSLGSEKQSEVELTSSDWQDIYADNAGYVREAAGGPRGGPWNVAVERAGEYEIALRRWPREIGKALGDSDGPMSKAFVITGAKVETAAGVVGVKAAATDQEAVVRVKLPVGQTKLQAWFTDETGQDVCGAFYAYVKRVGD